RLKFVVHCHVERSPDIPLPTLKAIAAGSFGFAQDDKVSSYELCHLSSASFALIRSKLGSCFASSLLSAYWMMPFLSMTNAERFATPAIPRFSCGRKESYMASYAFAVLCS